MTSLPYEARNTVRPVNRPTTGGSAEEMITGYWVTQAVYAAARFGLAEHLREGGLTAGAFARAEGLDAQAARRFLNVCVSLGLVTFDRRGRFNGTPLLDALRRDHSQAIRGFAVPRDASGRRLPWGGHIDAPWGDERRTFATLEPKFVDPLATTWTETGVFTGPTGSLMALDPHVAAQTLETRATDFVVDLGGANGALLFALLKANPSLAGVVFVRPELTPVVRIAAEAAGLGDRMAAIGGDLFQSVPDEGDLYLLNNILSDWNDAECVTILSNCRRAMLAGGRVVVIERLLGSAAEPGLASPIDVNTTIMPRGRERTLLDYRALFMRAGLAHVRVTPTGTPMVILEAFARSDPSF